MGCFMSDIESVQRITLKKFPTKTAKMCDIVRVGNLIVAKGKNGTVYTNHGLALRNGTRYMTYRDLDLIEAFFKIGMISKKDYDQIVARLNAEEAREEARYLLEDCAKDFEAFGIKLTKAQKAKLEKAMK